MVNSAGGSGSGNRDGRGGGDRTGPYAVGRGYRRGSERGEGRGGTGGGTLLWRLDINSTKGSDHGRLRGRRCDHRGGIPEVTRAEGRQSRLGTNDAGSAGDIAWVTRLSGFVALVNL
jgi:hypothetical protein